MRKTPCGTLRKTQVEDQLQLGKNIRSLSTCDESDYYYIKLIIQHTTHRLHISHTSHKHI